MITMFYTQSYMNPSCNTLRCISLKVHEHFQGESNSLVSSCSLPCIHHTAGPARQVCIHTVLSQRGKSQRRSHWHYSDKLQREERSVAGEKFLVVLMCLLDNNISKMVKLATNVQHRMFSDLLDDLLGLMSFDLYNKSTNCKINSCKVLAQYLAHKVLLKY